MICILVYIQYTYVYIHTMYDIRMVSVVPQVYNIAAMSTV